MSKYKVSIIGAGNLAWHLAPALDNAGFMICEVFNRSVGQAEKLVDRLYQAEVQRDHDFSQSKADVFLMAVNDNTIESMAQDIVLPDDAVLAHTSGAQSMGELSYAAIDNIGVFYPLQSFSKQREVPFEEIPICIEAQNSYTEHILMELADAISSTVVSIDSDKRKALHVAAVFANNFVNHFLRVTHDITKTQSLDLDLLYPLVKETVEKAFDLGPENVQTGPAKRHDYDTLDKHLSYLAENDELAEVYRIVSQHIVDTHPLD